MMVIRLSFLWIFAVVYLLASNLYSQDSTKNQYSPEIVQWHVDGFGLYSFLRSEASEAFHASGLLRVALKLGDTVVSGPFSNVVVTDEIYSLSKSPNDSKNNRLRMLYNIGYSFNDKLFGVLTKLSAKYGFLGKKIGAGSLMIREENVNGFMCSIETNDLQVEYASVGFGITGPDDYMGLLIDYKNIFSVDLFSNYGQREYRGHSERYTMSYAGFEVSNEVKFSKIELAFSAEPAIGINSYLSDYDQIYAIGPAARIYSRLLWHDNSERITRFYSLIGPNKIIENGNELSLILQSYYYTSSFLTPFIRMNHNRIKAYRDTIPNASYISIVPEPLFWLTDIEKQVFNPTNSFSMAVDDVLALNMSLYSSIRVFDNLYLSLGVQSEIYTSLKKGGFIYDHTENTQVRKKSIIYYNLAIGWLASTSLHVGIGLLNYALSRSADFQPYIQVPVYGLVKFDLLIL